MKSRARVIVKGRVQGVSFRYHTAQTAALFKVTGWVRNLPDGSVEACFEGDAADVRAVVTWCRKGPSSARVDEVHLEEDGYTGEFPRFQIRYDLD